MEYQDLGRRDYVNRRLRVKGRFISKEKALILLFGEENDEKPENYTFDQLKKMIDEKFGTMNEDVPLEPQETSKIQAKW